MATAVSPKTARRRGVTREHVLGGPVTEEQRSRRAVLGETLWAEGLLTLKKLLVQLFMVEGHTQITILPKSANQIGVSSMVSPQSGVLALGFVAPPRQIAGGDRKSVV